MPIQCPKCKASNIDTAKFCIVCDFCLASSAQATEQKPLNPKPQPLPGQQNMEDTLVATSPSRQPSGGFPRGPVQPYPQDQPSAKGASFFWKLLILLLFPVWCIPQLLWSRIVHKTSTGVVLQGQPLAKRAFFLWKRSILSLASCIKWLLFPVWCIPWWFWSLTIPVTFTGTVTHLHPWSPLRKRRRDEESIAQNWLFDLRRTDRKWTRPLSDRGGLLLPIVEVEFRSDKVHGPPLEEGSRVILRGWWRKVRLHAVKIWNYSPAMQTPILGKGAVFLGQVTKLHTSPAPDMRYPGERSLQVVNFQLQPTDENFQLLRDSQGNLSTPLLVEIRAQSISALPQDGDKVKVHGQIIGGILYTREVYNHSAGGAQVMVKEWAGIS